MASPTSRNSVAKTGGDRAPPLRLHKKQWLCGYATGRGTRPLRGIALNQLRRGWPPDIPLRATKGRPYKRGSGKYTLKSYRRVRRRLFFRAVRRGNRNPLASQGQTRPFACGKTVLAATLPRVSGYLCAKSNASAASKSLQIHKSNSCLYNYHKKINLLQFITAKILTLKGTRHRQSLFRMTRVGDGVPDIPQQCS